MAFRLQNDYASQAEADAIALQRQMEQRARFQALLQQAVEQGSATGAALQSPSPTKPYDGTKPAGMPTTATQQQALQQAVESATTDPAKQMMDALGALGTNAGDFQKIGNPNDFQFLQAKDPTTGQSYFQNVFGKLGQGGDYAMQQLQGLQGQLGQAYNPMGTATFNQNAFMNNFLANEGGLARIAQDRTSALGQSLEGIAARQARLGGEAALAAMPGARNSGAAMAAFGEAYASPFAQAQAQQQAAQLGLYQNLANQSLGQYGSNAQFGADLQRAYDFQNMAGQQSTQDRQAQLAQLYANMASNYMGEQSRLAGLGTEWYQPSYAAKKGTWDYITEGASALGDVGNFIGKLVSLGQEGK